MSKTTTTSKPSSPLQFLRLEGAFFKAQNVHEAAEAIAEDMATIIVDTRLNHFPVRSALATLFFPPWLHIPSVIVDNKLMEYGYKHAASSLASAVMSSIGPMVTAQRKDSARALFRPRGNKRPVYK